MPPTKPSDYVRAVDEETAEYDGERHCRCEEFEEVTHPINPFAAFRQSVFVSFNGSDGNSPTLRMP